MKKERAAFALVVLFFVGLSSWWFFRTEFLPLPKQAGPTYAESSDQSIVYRFAIHPLYNPTKLSLCYEPLIKYLNENLKGCTLELEGSKDYAAYEAKIQKHGPAFLLPNPLQTLLAQKEGYEVIAMAGKAEDFKGIFIARKDRAITKPEDLRGKSLAYPASTALAACIMPQWFLYQQKIDVNKELDNRFVGSQDSAIMSAYLKETDVGVTWPPPWRLFQKIHPEQAEELELIFETKSLLNNSIMIRKDVPISLLIQVQGLLLDLSKQPKGRVILKAIETDAFYPANDATYKTVDEFIKRFEAEVRPTGIFR